LLQQAFDVGDGRVALRPLQVGELDVALGLRDVERLQAQFGFTQHQRILRLKQRERVGLELLAELQEIALRRLGEIGKLLRQPQQCIEPKRRDQVAAEPEHVAAIAQQIEHGAGAPPLLDGNRILRNAERIARQPPGKTLPDADPVEIDRAPFAENPAGRYRGSAARLRSECPCPHSSAARPSNSN
jgi:hypothetical protein